MQSGNEQREPYLQTLQTDLSYLHNAALIDQSIVSRQRPVLCLF